MQPMTFDIRHPEILRAVRAALAEDLGVAIDGDLTSGDVTSELTVPASARANARMVTRQPLTLAGVELVPLIFDLVAPGACSVEVRRASGARLRNGDEIAFIHGPARALLTGERTALNFVQRLSGVATAATAYVDAIAGTGCRILDTRKTTPGLRRLEKLAVAAAGAINHRAGLYDAVLIKNNHITAAGGVAQALNATRGASVPVEIEVRTQAELAEALTNGATHLLLDNLTPPEATEWIASIRKSSRRNITIELSGGITLETARAYASTGADFISSGAITHSAPAVDINLRLELI